MTLERTNEFTNQFDLMIQHMPAIMCCQTACLSRRQPLCLFGFHDDLGNDRIRINLVQRKWQSIARMQTKAGRINDHVNAAAIMFMNRSGLIETALIRQRSDQHVSFVRGAVADLQIADIIGT